MGALAVMGVATFAFVFASFWYYRASLAGRMDDAERARDARRADRFWLLGSTLLFLAPSLVLLSVGLDFIGAGWFALWLIYVAFAVRYFPRVQTLWQRKVARATRGGVCILVTVARETHDGRPSSGSDDVIGPDAPLESRA
jgi:hypothetical protein